MDYIINQQHWRFEYKCINNLKYYKPLYFINLKADSYNEKQLIMYRFFFLNEKMTVSLRDLNPILELYSYSTDQVLQEWNLISTLLNTKSDKND